MQTYNKKLCDNTKNLIYNLIKNMLKYIELPAFPGWKTLVQKPRKNNCAFLPSPMYMTIFTCKLRESMSGG